MDHLLSGMGGWLKVVLPKCIQPIVVEVNLLAWHYKKYQREQTATDRKLYSDAEIAARKEKRGLWQDLDPILPWECRKGTQ